MSSLMGFIYHGQEVRVAHQRLMMHSGKVDIVSDTKIGLSRRLLERESSPDRGFSHVDTDLSTLAIIMMLLSSDKPPL